MGKCSICFFETDVREKFAGHMSAHVRRGEAEKRMPPLSPFGTCTICNRHFRNLKLHIRSHDPEKQKHFEELKSWGAIKSFIVRERGHRCERCGIAEWMGEKVPITLDHIDGNPDLHSKENLRLICPNCHAQTPTFGGKNKGKFPDSHRKQVMKRYTRMKTP